MPTEPITGTLEAARYPGKVMRALLGIREVALIIALVLASILMALLLFSVGAVIHSVDNAVNNPEPTTTECVGEVPC
jgi:hypothetical protein